MHGMQEVTGTAGAGMPLTGMTLLKTLLGALALCAVLLVGMALAVAPEPSGSTPPPQGLTAADVLASDGMGPDGRPDESRAHPPEGGRMAVGSTSETEPAG